MRLAFSFLDPLPGSLKVSSIRANLTFKIQRIHYDLIKSFLLFKVEAHCLKCKKLEYKTHKSTFRYNQKPKCHYLLAIFYHFQSRFHLYF